MNTKTLDQIKDEYYGEVGMPERDRLEREVGFDPGGTCKSY